MPTDLTPGLRAGDWPDGSVVGADGVVYRRRSTRLRRREADVLVASGLPVVLDLWSRRQLDWYAGADAAEVWARERPRVVVAEPTAQQLAKGVVWTAGVWEAFDGERIVYLTGRC